MYHVFCEDFDVATVTPDFVNARRVFFGYIRDYPASVVTCHKIEGLGADDTPADIMNGIYEGRAVRIMHCDPAT